MKTLAVCGIKGGVGKTTAAVNLAYLASLGGSRVLIWDLDPQGAAGFYLRERHRKGGTRALMRGARTLRDGIRETEFRNLHLHPSSFSDRNLPLYLEAGDTELLRELLEPLGDRYDYVVLDCPPGASTLAERVAGGSDALLLPLIPTPLSLRTFDQLRHFLRKWKLDAVPVWPFFSMVDRRRKLHREVPEAFALEVPELLAGQIPYSSEVEQMGVRRAPLPAFGGDCAAVVAYRELWREVSCRLDATRSRAIATSHIPAQGSTWLHLGPLRSPG